jgi:hypothetical protein
MGVWVGYWLLSWYTLIVGCMDSIDIPVGLFSIIDSIHYFLLVDP